MADTKMTLIWQPSVSGILPDLIRWCPSVNVFNSAMACFSEVFTCFHIWSVFNLPVESLVRSQD